MITIPKAPHSQTLRWDDPQARCTFDAGSRGLIEFVLLKHINGGQRYSVDIITTGLSDTEADLIKSIIIKHAETTGYGVAAQKENQ